MKKEKEKPNLGLSGALTEDTNTYRGVVIKYNEPPEARKPKKRWRLYPFKGTEALKVRLNYSLMMFNCLTYGCCKADTLKYNFQKHRAHYP